MNGSFKKKKIYFSQVSNEALRDKNLSLKAKGLYALIQSYITIENFTLYKNTLLKQCKEGDKAFESAWKELKNNGYLIQEKHRDEKGSFYYIYDLLDKADHTPKKEGMDSADMENRGNIINTDFSNTDLNNTDKSYLHFLLENDSCFSYSIREYINIYLKYHRIYLNKEHVRIKESNLSSIEENLKNIAEDITLEDFEKEVEDYFIELPKNNNGSIISFLTASKRIFDVDSEFSKRKLKKA